MPPDLFTFTDTFSSPSSLWSNSIGNWTANGGQYFAQAPSNNPETYSGLPFDFTNSTFSLTVTINSLRDEGIWLDTDGSRNNGVLLVLGGNAQAGNWAYWHVFQNGNHSAPLNVNTNAFTPDLTYTVTVLVNGNTYQAFKDPDGIYDANSVLLTTLVDDTYSHGHVGLYDFYSATSFSNFSVSGLPVPGTNYHAPVITTAASQFVAENTTFVAALTSTDIDTVGMNPATFSISGGVDAALFDIVGGNLVFKAARDFEADPHSYQVQVSAFDGVNITEKKITVNLTDANDTAPVITTTPAPIISILTDLNNLDAGTFAYPLTVGIYTFTTDDGSIRYANFGVNNSGALGDNTDLGFINIEIAPEANVTKIGFLVGLAGEAQHHKETVSFFDTNNVLLTSIGISRDGGFEPVSFENTAGYIGRVLVTDIDLRACPEKT